MAVVKRSVSINEDVWEELQGVASHREVSAVINEALADYLWRRRALAAVADWESEHGALTREELHAARDELDALGLPDLRRAVG